MSRPIRARLPAIALGAALAAALSFAVSCGGGLKTISKDGYTATLAYSPEEQVERRHPQ